ncbi:transporter substrate-binding domain-containing protein [Aphanothece sacrum]|uniref:ABC transporter substrate-binding protein n=1 Tax=Aphanothece sacrum FPU1 TaxID=1920663 RepID=A0A401IIH9_APHSA|nr:transporter substrate-binding domain-containing protein [Aphanothece sacrum]GBF81125.1 ABC transporter substrate-binding protein [Aphanothece sacrum FPU1]GBF86219.1 ABC transporter substrate-binding protein [Aphanothece sacrum FPU3]
MTIIRKLFKRYYFLTVILIILLILSQNSVGVVPRSQDISQLPTSQSPTNRQDTIFFGALLDAYPISGIEGNEGFSGYCKNLMDYLQQNVYQKYEIKQATVAYEQRFQGIGKDKNTNETVPLDLECSANTITPERRKNLDDLILNINNPKYKDLNNKPYPGSFSIPFFTTGAKILLKKGTDNENLNKYYRDELFNNEEGIIAVIGPSTTTNTLVKAIYPKATIKAFPDRVKALEEVREQENIIAYITDEIILKAMIKKNENNYNPEKYALVPQNGLLSDEDYGVIIYKNGKINDLLSVINTWIQTNASAEAKKELEKYDNFLKSYWNKPISSWYKGDLWILWLILLSAMILPLIFFNLLCPWIINRFVKAIPEKFALWLYKVSQGRIILIIGYFQNKAIIEDKIIRATINELPSYNDEQRDVRKLLTQLNQGIVENSELDSQTTQKALDGLREIAYECKKPNMQGENIQRISDGLNKVLETFNTGVSRMNDFLLKMNELKETINNLQK